MGMSPLQYADQLRALLPPGKALADGGAGVLTQLLDGFSQEFARADQSAGNLVDESLPDSTLQLLPDWERVCNLPDGCTPVGQSIAARQQAVVARFIGNGTPSIPYLTNVAAQLGYPVTITRGQARRSGMTCGTAYGGLPMMFTWLVQSPLNAVQSRKYGAAAYGEPYARWQNAVLECVLRQHAPAQTIVLFIYTSAAPPV